MSPTEPAGTVDLTVVTPGGTSATSVADEFTYEPGPVVTSVNPPSGSPAGGTSVTIDGSGFTGATGVKFGSAAAPSFTVNTDSQITATTPAGAAGQVDVTVSTPGGTSATGPSDVYTFSTVTGCTETWTGATDSQWSTASNWSNGNVPSFGDEVCIPAGASNLPVELSSSASIKTLNNQGSLDVGGSLTISGSGSVSSGALTAEGTIAGNGSLSVTGSMTTNGATFGGPGAVTVQSGSTWEIASTTVSGGSVVNDGTAAIDSTDALNLGAGVTVTNNGTMTMYASSQIYGYNTTSVFANAGTLVVSPGSIGTALLGNYNNLVVNNTGSIQIASGTLDVLGATLNLNGGSVSGPGTLDVQGTLGINSAQTLANPFVVQGTVNGNSPLSVTGTMTTNGTFYGPGTVTVQSGATWEVASTTVSGGSVVNDGTATIDSTDAFYLGVWGHGDQQRHHDHGSGFEIYGYNTTSVFANPGTLVVSPGSTGTATLGDAN